MKASVPNPDFEQTPYALAWIMSTGQIVEMIPERRFDEVPPEDIWLDKNSERLRQWMAEHEVPSHIIQEQPNDNSTNNEIC